MPARTGRTSRFGQPPLPWETTPPHTSASPFTMLVSCAKMMGREVKNLANIKSAVKRIKLAAIRRDRNRARKSIVKTAIRRFETAVRAGNAEAIREAYRVACSQLDKAVSKGVLHRNTAARKKSRLSRQVG